MPRKKSFVDHYLSEFHAGHADNAFHSLAEASAEIIPELINAFESTDAVDSRAFLIDVVSEFRLESSNPFLGHALLNDDPRIWKIALDGLVMAESSGAIEAMRHVLPLVSDDYKRRWIEEAITDTLAAIACIQDARE